MHSKASLLALPFSLICLASSLPANAGTVSFGSDYFMTVSNYASGEQMSGGYFVGDTTISIYADNGGVQGALIGSYTAFCVDFNDKIHTPQTYLVEAQGIGTNYNSSYSPTPGSQSAVLSSTKLEDDATLGAEFNYTLANDTNTQVDIWDEGGAWFTLTSAEQAEATAAENAAGGGNYTGDVAFLEINGDGQSFMVDGTPTPTAVTPEPSTLLLLGTGVLGTIGAVRRRMRLS
jgi:hypothetical protein